MESNPPPLHFRRICRFCLSDSEPLNSIYERNHKSVQLPLQLQIMSCVAIEVYTEDEMPQVICNTCRWNLDHFYKFKLQCKKADEALRDCLLSGKLPKPFPPIRINPLTENDKKRPAESRSQNEILKKQRISNDDSRNIRERRETRRREKGRERESQNENQNISEQHLYEKTENEQNRDSESNQEASNIKENGEHELAEVKVHACDQCERTFALRQALLLHVQRIHVRARNYKCNECEKNFFNKHDLVKHLSIHLQEKPYSCSICQKQFSRLTSLQRHKKVHKDEPHYICSHCDDEFFTTEELEEHKNSAHKKEKPFQCNICKKRFLYKQGLQRHETLHNNKDEKFVCDYCKETFRTCTKLARHLITHAGPRPYMCKLCPRTFLLSHHLTRHMRMSHSKEKRRVYKNGKKSLKVNQLTHAKRTYMGLTCDICQESCRNRADYVIHIKQHIEAGEKIDPDSLQPNTKKNLKLKSNERKEKEKDQHSNRNDDDESPGYVVKKLPKPSMLSENEKKKEQTREDKKENSEKQEKEEPNVMYVRSRNGSMVKITTFPPIDIHDIQEQKAIFKSTKQTSSIDSPSQSSSKGLTSSQTEETPKSGYVDDTELQVQKIVTSVSKKQKTLLKDQQNGQDQSKESLTPVMRVHSSSQENSKDNDKSETLTSTPNTITVKRIKRIVVRKPTGGSNKETSASTSSIKDGDSSLSGTLGSRKIKRVIVSRIIRKNDVVHEVIMNPDGTTIDSTELAKLSTGNVVKRVVRQLPLDKNQNMVQALLQSTKQRQKTEDTNEKFEVTTSASTSNDTPESSDALEKKQLITLGQNQEIIYVEAEAIGDVAEIVDIEN
ncbi:PREDICTED: zinc finger protein 62 homolog isoform X1 [Trachymyrmex septentrionalis]|uniref:zinc finger protein 62 homolog isoform X1 n=2 Tax=Trachymyrmex septentrionalis TaxID=34720 RepID=UPI00084F0F97|nr:PREDICTED: zinc finger protein 62 homolog isoform X1 [Trachymyrmex septentrionalis]